tara:strand:+ start:101025 stop:101663 length:639 start_codon:yes stop_codon:yes gene_type:complete
MKKPSIILVGGGGHCKSCIDVIEQENKYIIGGIVDVKEKVGGTILGYSIIGSDDDLPQIAKKYDYFLITLGQIKSAEVRIKLFRQVKKLNKRLPSIVSPLAYVSQHAKIDEGTIIMHNAAINAGSSIGKNCIINTNSLIEHDSIIDNNCHVSTRATINGNCTIDSGVFIGSGSILNQGISITNSCIIGSGSVVLNNIEIEQSIWVGNPAKQK